MLTQYLSWLGYEIPQHTPVVGIRKDRGAYRVISATSQFDCNGCTFCETTAMMDDYNAGPDVQAQLANHNLGPLHCTGLPSTDGIGSEGQDGDDPFAACNDLPFPGNGDLWAYMNALLDCIGNVGSGNGTGGIGTTYSAVLCEAWHGDGTSDQVFGVSVPDGKDPKLIQVDKKELDPGLYEFIAVLNNGQILRHFIDFDEPQVINADFADFIQVNIYPVPVTEQDFAVDIDLLVPTQVELTIVNNMGKSYYEAHLDFDLPGRQKHVVKMDEPWPSGIYHAVLVYGDGSSTSKTFSVD